MKKSRNGNFTVYEEDDNCALDEYSETLGEELEQAKENQDEKIETLQGENEELKAELKQIKDILPTVSAEGTNITLTPTIEDIFKEITIKGNTEQTTYTGKNKLNYSLSTLQSLNTHGTWNNNVYTISGVTITINEDLSIAVNGTSIEQIVFTLKSGLGVSTGEYYLSGCIDGSNQTYDVRIYNYDGTQNVKQNITGDTLINVIDNGQTGANYAIVIRNNVTLNNKIFYPMLRLASITDNTYEPYVGGTASPNPDYPQNVKVVTGDNTVVISDGNNTKSQRLPLNLGNIELCKIGDYQDYIYKSNSKWYKHQTINKYIISSSDVTGINQYWYSQYGVYAVLIPKTVFGLETSRETIKMFCNKFINNDLFVNNSLTCSDANSTSVVFFSTKFTNLANAKEILTGTIVYNPKEPEEIEITDTTLISQLEAISKATAYSEETNITTECEEENVQAVIYAEAIADLKELINT